MMLSQVVGTDTVLFIDLYYCHSEKLFRVFFFFFLRKKNYLELVKEKLRTCTIANVKNNSAPHANLLKGYKKIRGLIKIMHI